MKFRKTPNAFAIGYPGIVFIWALPPDDDDALTYAANVIDAGGGLESIGMSAFYTALLKGWGASWVPTDDQTSAPLIPFSPFPLSSFPLGVVINDFTPVLWVALLNSGIEYAIPVRVNADWGGHSIEAEKKIIDFWNLVASLPRSEVLQEIESVQSSTYKPTFNAPAESLKGREPMELLKEEFVEAADGLSGKGGV